MTNDTEAKNRKPSAKPTDDDPKGGKAPSSYFAQQQIADALEPRGRYGELPKPYIVGSEAAVLPPAAPTWSQGPQPPAEEPPTGYEIDAVPE